MAGIVTVRHLLCDHPPPASYGGLSAPSLSHKAWTDDYHPILTTTVYAPTYNGVNTFLAKDQYVENSSNTEDASDAFRLDNPAYLLNYLEVVHHQTEADTDRDFYQNIALPVSLAWQNNGKFLERSQSGPPGPTNTNKTVDHLYSWMAGGVEGNERCQVIGEMKKHGVIREREWRGETSKSEMTQRLGRELRAYAFLYKCPQVFVYDGKHLLIVSFKAKDANEIRAQNCPIDCCVLARSPDDVTQCAARYALYRLVWRGWMRMTAEFSINIRVSLNGWDRVHIWWSGRPRWVSQDDPRQKVLDHPNGYIRRLNNGAWQWVDGNGVLSVWDTTQAWQ